jgi:esterase/lipase
VGDTFVSVKNAHKIHGSLRSKGKELFLVERSSHVLTRDYDKDRILEKCLEFVRQILQSPE